MVVALCLLTVSLPVVTRTSAAEIAIERSESAPCPRTFELVTPDDWRCEEEASPQCTVCRNRSLHYTELVVRCVRDDTRERVSMPPGGRMSICGGQGM